MPATELLEIELDGGTVRGTLYKPDIANGSPVPAVLICRGVYCPEDAQPLFEELTAALCEAGIAAAMFEHRCADLILEDFDAHCAGHDVQDACAALEWLMNRPQIDQRRVGIIGYSLGAIAVASLASRNGDFSRVCLLAAATAKYICEHNSKIEVASAPLNGDRLPASYAPSLNDVDSPQEIASFKGPVLVLHGAADQRVAPEVSWQYVKARDAAKQDVQHVLVARGNHTFSSPQARDACIEQLVRCFAAMDATQSPAPAIAGGA